MAVIYKATDPGARFGRSRSDSASQPDERSRFLKRFRQEARNVANLSPPEIRDGHDVGIDGNTHYIVMELHRRWDLKRLIRAGSPFSSDRALSIAIKICAGVGYAHGPGWCTPTSNRRSTWTHEMTR
jgi:serine/threonine-protein kinase